MSSLLNKYTDPSIPGSFSGLSGFEKNNKKFTNDQIKKELLDQKTYTQHVLPFRNFKRNKVIVGGIDDTWQADLVDVQKLKYQNKHYNYVLTVIDVFSKYAWALPIKFKKANDTYEAFKTIIENSKRIPKKLHIDGGNEFKGRCKTYLEELKIELYIVESKMKASVVERFNRTLKEKMWRMFTFNNNKKYFDALPLLLDSYNKSYHRSIKNKPYKISKKNEDITFYNLYGFKKEQGGPNELIQFKFSLGDYVRVVITKNLFEKGYTSNWSDDLFIIDEKIPRIPPVYKLRTLNNEILTRSFYEQEIQLVKENEFPIDTFEVLESDKEKILVKKLNEEQAEPYWVNKKQFLNE